MQDKDYLLTYKLPKSIINGFAFLQNNHRLRYMYYEGKIKGDEYVAIDKKGFFIAHGNLSSSSPPSFLRVSFERTNESVTDMWKKTDFKIAFDEIKLYEVADDKRTQWEKQLEQREQALTEQENLLKNIPGSSHTDTTPQNLTQPGSPPGPANIPAEDTVVESEVLSMINPSIELMEQTAPGQKTETGPSRKNENPPQEISTQTQPMQQAQPDTGPSSENTESIAPTENPPAQKSAPSPFKQNVVEMFEDKVVDFVPIQELILDEEGKSAEEYKSAP